jgi:hypothetical protein
VRSTSSRAADASAFILYFACGETVITSGNVNHFVAVRPVLWMARTQFAAMKRSAAPEISTDGITVRFDSWPRDWNPNLLRLCCRHESDTHPQAWWSGNYGFRRGACAHAWPRRSHRSGSRFRRELCRHLLSRGLYKPPALPCTLGTEAAGVVTAIGDGVENIRVGDRVAYATTLGSYAEFAAVPHGSSPRCHPRWVSMRARRSCCRE